MKGLLRQEDLARYADAVVRVGLSVGRGDDLLVTCQPLHRELAVALVEAAYRARARSVDVDYVDPLVRAAYLRSAPDSSIGHVPSWRATRVRSMIKPETASLWIAGESEPGALDGIPGERVAADLTRSQQRFGAVRRASRIGKRRWAVAAWATPAWAESVYPEVKSEAAQRRLARDLLSFCRVGPDDPPGVTACARISGLSGGARSADAAGAAARGAARRPAPSSRSALHREGAGSGGGMNELLRQANGAEPAHRGVLHVADRFGDRRNVSLLAAAHVPGAR